MTATQTRLRRGTNAQVNAMTPAADEAVVDTTNNRLCLGNGSTAGGFPIPNFRDLQQSAFITGTVGGTANAITLTLTPALAAYANGVRLIFKATANNTGATTINVNGLGARNIFKLSGTSLVACTGGEIVSGAWYEIIDDGTQFQLAGGVGGSSGSDRQTFNTSGTWTKPSGFPSSAMCLIECWGGGGSGATNNSVIGGNGGSTSFGSHVTAYGGSGAASGGLLGGAGGGFLGTTNSRTNDTSGQGSGHGGTAGTASTPGYFTGGGGAGPNFSNPPSGSVYGGGGGGNNLSGNTIGGSSVYGGAGGNSGLAGTQPGGGGAGTSGAAGGGGGSYASVFKPISELSSSETVTVGAGGTGGGFAGGAGRVRITVFG